MASWQGRSSGKAEVGLVSGLQHLYQPLGGGEWVQAVGCRLRLQGGEEAAMAGRRLGTEIAGTSPATNNSPPQTAQWETLALAWLVWEEERHPVPAASVHPEQSPPSSYTPPL